MTTSMSEPSHATNGLAIAVTDPTKHNEGVNAYIGYSITTNADDTREEFQAPRTTVLRRYSDFHFLHAKLGHAFPGTILPPLPDKALVGRFGASFVEGRRRALERYLLRVAKHPELGASRELVLFLQADEATLQHAKEEWKRSQRNQPQKVLKLFKQAFTQMEQSLSHAPTGHVTVPPSELDGRVDGIAARVHLLEVHYHSVAREASGWIRGEKEAGDGCFQLGLALTLLGQNEAGGLGEAIRSAGHAIDGVSAVALAAVEDGGVLLEEPLVEWSRAVGAAKVALLRRAEARKVYLESLVEVATRLHVKGKWVGMIGKEEKLNAAELAWSKAVEVAEKKKGEYEEVSERLVRDWGTFREEKAREVHRVLVAFAEAQVTRHEKMRKAWEEAMPKVREGGREGGREGMNGAGEAPPMDIFLAHFG
ncbi:sorting nexin 1 [Nannochloropsis oceanica]